MFTLEPKPVEPAAPPALSRGEQWPVVAADASQGAAVALARTGTDYIVQGPPGTGKSQSITNLIADYVARGKRVLFVCEKRAAIDVVFHRLRQQGLDELCCLIHDSQTDKKGFVLDLKQTYERWLAEPDQLDGLLATRAAVLRQAEQDLGALARFDAAMRAVPADVQAPLRELIGRLVAMRDVEPVLTPAEMERLPSAAEWRAHGELARRLTATLQETTGALTLASHAFRWLGAGVLQTEFPLATLTERCDRAQELLDQIDVGFEAVGLPVEHRDRIADLEALFAATARLQPIAARGQLELLDPQSALARELRELADRLAAQVQQLAAAEEGTEAWRDKLSASETQAALSQARALEGSVLRLLRPAWWRLRRTIDQRYDFDRHDVRPRRSQVLLRLQAEHEARAAVAALRARAHQRFGASDPAELLAALQPLQVPAEPALRAFCQRARDEGGAQVVEAVAGLLPGFTALLQVLDGLLLDWRSLRLSELGGIVRSLREDADVLPDLLLSLCDLLQAPPAFARALRTFDLSPDELEAATLRSGLEALYRAERWLPRFDAQVLGRHVERLAAAERELLGHNAAVVRAQVRRNFRAQAQRATVAASQLDAEGKAWKKSYVAGRRDLEHEFGKTMRYKSIRDLAAGEPGMVVRDLKPIWLMSPLSVSDTLPLQAGLFDVVIFDEASQIPVEEAVPALWRAPQVIVVGDEMQLPPTSFFASAREEDEDDVGETVAVLLEASSLLNQCARNLPATLLAWHYRSRSESLIGFSNAAFYGGSLFTIPDQRLPAPGLPEIVVAEEADVAAKADALLQRPLSFHFVAGGIYDQRCNAREAAYLAQLVRELLRRNTGMSLGIVAFSEAQQTEIESALESLAGEDPDFAVALEAEYVREEQDQFCGLFVKNLENVQGDERDVILLSICYGKGPDGRMQMNFGPINQRGGEKRLNVIFSRARRHMAVISSIKDAAITNSWNDGAQALQGFLRYAEACSRGDAATARGVLQSLNPGARKALGAPAVDAVATQIAAALRERGWRVDEQVGQSRFRCDLALRRQDAAGYAAGVLIDNDEHYRNPDLLERYVTRPRLLAAFDWRVVQVLARDWYHEPDVVLSRIERLARGEAEVLPEVALVKPPEPDTPAAAVVAEPTATPEPRTRRRFEFVDGTSRKFWEIGREDKNLTVRFGRIGSSGQTQTRTLASAERAERELQQLVAEKLGKGYRETT